MYSTYTKGYQKLKKILRESGNYLAKMMHMRRTKLTGLSPMNGNTTNGGVGEGGVENWEIRPCGMLVQKRLDVDQHTKPPPTIRIRVKFGSIYHGIDINSQATFGELKKMLSGPTGLHHEDQKLYYKDKERDSKQFLDIVGVKDKSKVVLVDDPLSQEKRYLEMRKNANMEQAAKCISQISLEVDRLVTQVSALESVILEGGKIGDKEVTNLIEMLMNELIKLDGIVADGDVKLQRKTQVTRVQRYVETLDILNIKNSTPKSPSQNQQQIPNGHVKSSVFTGNGQIQTPERGQERATNGVKPPQMPQQQQRHSIGHSPLQPISKQEQPSRHSASPTLVTTQWETFESTHPLIPVSPSSSYGPVTSDSVNPKFPWDIFE